MHLIHFSRNWQRTDNILIRITQGDSLAITYGATNVQYIQGGPIIRNLEMIEGS